MVSFKRGSKRTVASGLVGKVYALPKSADKDKQAGRLLEFIHLDYMQDSNGHWVMKPTAEFKAQAEGAYSEYSFSIVRTCNRYDDTYKLQVNIHNNDLVNILREVLGDLDGISWNVVPLYLDPQLLLTFYPQLKERVSNRPANESLTDGEMHLDLLLKYLDNEHRTTLLQIQNLQDHEEVSFDLLWYILVPRTLFFLPCPVSGEPRVAKLISGNTHTGAFDQKYWDLKLEYTDAAGSTDANSPVFGRAVLDIMINSFKGTKKITSMAAYPLSLHPQADELAEKLIERGQKWAGLDGCHHMRYDGVAYQYNNNGFRHIRVKIASRVMLDKVTYKQTNLNHYQPAVNVFRDSGTSDASGFGVVYPDEKVHGESGTVAEDLSEEQLLTASPLLYGFSLSDKLWLIFVVDQITEIQWQTDAFDNLVLPKEQKDLIKALVESHRGTMDSQDQFDDFIVGKGRGLIINLFGPPGVGKTLSAEATSEYVRRPLYVAGVDEISENVEENLKKIFSVAATWKAIVLIDEADVFLERRSVHDLARNALVAVFLRKLEYYEGVLFLTTNRVKVFDEAFQSRIHVSLRYHDLSTSAKRQIWSVFLQKAGMKPTALTEEQLVELAGAKVNGRQIKNAARSCQGLARSRGEDIGYGHIKEVLSIMDQFERDFRAELRKGEEE